MLCAEKVVFIFLKPRFVINVYQHAQHFHLHEMFSCVMYYQDSDHMFRKIFLKMMVMTFYPMIYSTTNQKEEEACRKLLAILPKS